MSTEHADVTQPKSWFEAPLIRNGTDEQYATRANDERAKLKQRQAEAIDRAAPVVNAVCALIAAEDVTLSRVVSESGIRRADLAELLKKSPPVDGPEYWNFRAMNAAVQQLDSWIKADAPRHGVPIDAPTPTHRGIFNLCMDASARKLLYVIVATAGVGKTTAAAAATRSKPRRWDAPGLVKIQMTESDRSVNQFLRRLYFAVTQKEPRAMGDEVHGELCKVLRAGDVVIIDECQRLAGIAKGSGIEAVRDLFDQSKASLVLMGNESLKRRSNMLDDRLYVAFQSRARIEADRFMYSREDDVDEYMAWRDVHGAKLRARLVRAFALHIGSSGDLVPPARGGGLRGVAQVFDRAEESNPDQTLTAAMVLEQMDAMGW